MQANWSLILNVLMLIVVIVAIGRVMRARRQTLKYDTWQPSPSQPQMEWNDDIIAVRKVETETVQQPVEETTLKPRDKASKKAAPKQAIKSQPILAEKKAESTVDNKVENLSTIMLLIAAKDNRQFAGYELLQTVLASGLRFGEGQLFHRHQEVSGHGPILFSLAAATATGVFDLQNIGAVSVKGLCLYMHLSDNPGIDQERFEQMIETAKQLSEGLDAHLLDDQRKPFNKTSASRYQQILQQRMEVA